ncbi:outer membrane protein beta-barrel domain protein [Leptospira wolbachii serovar Codice str. CDC]|uniref:Outer membrane protein beta-barrel domain protein n=1 Tax=Leptospira wolbachii serovar Codice str. CDC TaxID=1218599 RepID=R9A9J9_9LEPT|nr:outer membrane protein beta-barrel domain protein [Leptospira wolbachii serovar Codice str. CDC]
MNLQGGDTVYSGGSITKRETSLQNSLKSQSQVGILPTKLLGSVNIPPSLPIADGKIETGRTGRISFEYGVTDHLGISISYATTTVKGERLEQLIYVDRTNSAGYSPYLEATPTKYTLYSDKVYGLGLNYHFLSKNRFDPFVGLEVGFVNFNASYRTTGYSNLYLQNLTAPGTGVSGRASAGINYYLTPEFGFMIEIHGMKRMLKSNSFSSESFDQVGFQFGVIFNLDNISKDQR